MAFVHVQASDGESADDEEEHHGEEEPEEHEEPTLLSSLALSSARPRRLVPCL